MYHRAFHYVNYLDLQIVYLIERFQSELYYIIDGRKIK